MVLRFAWYRHVFRKHPHTAVFPILIIGIPEAMGILRRCILVGPDSKIGIPDMNICIG